MVQRTNYNASVMRILARLKGGPMHFAALEVPVELGNCLRAGMLPLVLGVLLLSMPSPEPARLVYESIHAAAAAGDVEAVRAFFINRAVAQTRDGQGRSALHVAAERGHTEVVWAFLEFHRNSALYDDHGITPLHLAANREIADSLIRTHAARAAKSYDDGWTPLHMAASAEVAEVLFDAAPQQLEMADKHGRTPLDRAVDCGKIDVVRFLLAKHANVNPTDDKRRSPLHSAVGKGRSDLVQLLLQAGAELNGPDEIGSFLLGNAGERADLATIRLLLAGGANASKTYPGCTSPLLGAVLGKSLACVQELLAAGAPASAPKGSEHSPLGIAAAGNSAPIVQALLEAGADPNFRQRIGDNALFAAARGGGPEVIRLLVAAGAVVDERGGGGTPLAEACRRGSPAAVKALLAAGADVHHQFVPKELLATVARRRQIEMAQTLIAAGAQPDSGALYAAIKVNNLALVQLFLDHNASPNPPRDGYNPTPLELAVRDGKAEIVIALLAAGAKPKRGLDYWPEGTNLLCLAANQPDPRIMKALLATGLDPNRIVSDGGIPLNRAALSGHIEVVRALLDAGANPNLSNEYESPALHSAQNGDIVRLLISRGAELPWHGYTPLHSANNAEVVQTLVACGANLAAHGESKDTALHSAAQSGRTDVVKAILVAGADPAALDWQGRTPVELAKTDEVRRVFAAHASTPTAKKK